MSASEIQEIVIITPARIHCGLFSAGRELPVEFGGCGMMVDSPATIVRFGRPSMEAASRSSEDQVAAWVRRWLSTFEHRGTPTAMSQSTSVPFQVFVEQQPTPHIGMGTGSQLAAAVAVGISLFQHLALPSAYEIAARMERGRRSAIGISGFFQGGFLVDRGAAVNQPVSTIESRHTLPDDWRCVIVTPSGQVGLFGNAEQSAFQSCPASSADFRAGSIELVRNHVLPALAAGHVAEFGEALYDFNRRSGRMFEASQGGIYCSEATSAIIEWIRCSGFPGAVQSSWGPSVAAVIPDPDAASQLEQSIRNRFGSAVDIVVTRFNNSGARVQTRRDGALESEWTLAAIDSISLTSHNSETSTPRGFESKQIVLG